MEKKFTLNCSENELKLIQEGLLKVFNSNEKLLKESNQFSTNANEKAQLENENKIVSDLYEKISLKLQKYYQW